MNNQIKALLVTLLCAGYVNVQGAALQLDANKKQKTAEGVQQEQPAPAFAGLEVLSAAVPAQGQQAAPDVSGKEIKENSAVAVSRQKDGQFGGDPLLSMVPVAVQQIIKSYYLDPFDYFGMVYKVSKRVSSDKNGRDIQGCHRIAITSDGSLFVTASLGDDAAHLWHNEEHIAALRHTSRVPAATISPDGKTVVTGSWDRTIKIWDNKGKLESTIAVGNPVQSVAIAPNRSIVAVGSDGKVRVYVKNELKREFLPHPMRKVSEVAFAPDNSIVCLTKNHGLVWCHNNDMESMVLPQGQDERYLTFAVAPDATLVTGSNEDAKVWRNGRCVAELPHIGSVTSVAIAPYALPVDKVSKEEKLSQACQNMIVTGCSDDRARIWVGNQCKLVLPMTMGIIGAVSSAVALADDNTIVFGDTMLKPDQNAIKKTLSK